MVTFFGFVSLVVVFALVIGLRSRMRLVELRVYGASPIPAHMKAELEGAARAAAADAYARSVAAATAAAAARDEAMRRSAAERSAADEARRAASWAAASAGTAAATATAEPPRPATVERLAEHPVVEPVERRERPASTPEDLAAAPVAASRTATAPVRPPKKINWELFAGGRLMNVAGALALVVGFVLLLKYAFDQNWIDAQLRVASGVIAGAVAIGSAMVMHAKRKTWFVHGVFGVGIGVWYASGYAAFAGYHLLPALAAYAFMVGVTVAAFAIALRYDSIAVALVGWAGGFVVPFVAGGTGASEIGLASYLVLLDCGLLAISLVKRRWFVLQPLALAGSYVTAVAWYIENGSGAPAGISALAIASLWLVFFGAETIDVLREPTRRTGLKVVSSLVNLVASGTMLATVLGNAPGVLETVAALAAAAYAATYAGVLRFASAQLVYRYLYAYAAAALAALFVAERFYGTSFVLAFVGMALTVAGCSRLRRGSSRQRIAFEALGVSFGAFTIAASFTAFLVYAGADARFDVLYLALAFAGFAIDRLWRHATVPGIFGLVSRFVAVVAIVFAELRHVAGGEAGLTFACDALALALVELALRRRRSVYGYENESTIVSGLLLALGAGAIVWSPDGSARDLATIVWTLVAFTLGAIPAVASPLSPIAAIAFRCAGVAGVAEFEWTHASADGLATLYAASAIGVAAVERVARPLLRRATAPSAFAIASIFLGLGALTWLVQPGAFDTSDFHVALGSRDGALLACIVAFFIVDRLSNGSAAKPAFGGPILRALGLFALVSLDVVHLRGNALATTFAFEALALAGIDRALRAAGTEYASGVEAFGSGTALGAAAALAFGTSALPGGASMSPGHTVALWFGGVDLALASFAVTALVYGRIAAARGIAGSITTILRQCAAAAAFVAVAVHLSGFERSDGFALLALAFSFAGARTRSRDLRIDGAIALGLGLVELVFARVAGVSYFLPGFAFVRNESLACFMINAVATIVASELCRRSAQNSESFSVGLDRFGRGGRIGGALLAIVGVTTYVHDVFERAAAVAPLDRVRIESLEQLTISVAWIVASLAFVCVGIRLRIREFRLLAIGLFDLTILKAFFVDVYALETPYRIVSFIVLGATLMAVSYLYGRFEKRLFGTDGATDGVAQDDVALAGR